MSQLEEADVYALTGHEGFRRLVASFYRRVPDDDVLGPMYPADDLAGAEERLRGFLEFRFGGPSTYIEQRGHPALRMRHAPHALTAAARNRWVELMSQALDEAELPDDVVTLLRDFFGRTATFLINQPE